MAKARPQHSELVKQLREAIRQSGRSLNQLSQACGVGRDRLSRFVRGERDLTLDAAGKICEALGLVLVPRKEASPAAEPKEPKGRKKA